MAAPVLGGLRITEVRQTLHAILKAHPKGEVDLHGRELDFVLRCLPLHPSAALKIGSGVKRIFVGPDGGAYGTRCFHIERTDETTVLISHKTIGAKGGLDARDTMREVIEPQLTAVRQQYEVELCKACGKATRAQADHVVPFSVLRDRWLRLEGLKYQEIAVRKISEQGYATQFADAELQRRWEQYHLDHASYQPLCPKCNRRKSNGEIKPVKPMEPVDFDDLDRLMREP